jgi:riboflavin biosynthesis pyrimidine reductase
MMDWTPKAPADVRIVRVESDWINVGSALVIPDADRPQVPIRRPNRHERRRAIKAVRQARKRQRGR